MKIGANAGLKCRETRKHFRTHGNFQLMKTIPSEETSLTMGSARAGVVTCEAGRRRAYELAVINGRTPVQVSKSDWEQAGRELRGADTGSEQAGV